MRTVARDSDGWAARRHRRRARKDRARGGAQRVRQRAQRTYGQEHERSAFGNAGGGRRRRARRRSPAGPRRVPASLSRAPASASRLSAKEAAEKVGEKAKETVGEKIDEAGGAGGVAKGGRQEPHPEPSCSGSTGERPEGRRPERHPRCRQGSTVARAAGRRCGCAAADRVQPSWTQFEEWPQLMHRLDQATQEEDATVSLPDQGLGRCGGSSRPRSCSSAPTSGSCGT